MYSIYNVSNHTQSTTTTPLSNIATSVTLYIPILTAHVIKFFFSWNFRRALQTVGSFGHVIMGLSSWNFKERLKVKLMGVDAANAVCVICTGWGGLIIRCAVEVVILLLGVRPAVAVAVAVGDGDGGTRSPR